MLLFLIISFGSCLLYALSYRFLLVFTILPVAPCISFCFYLFSNTRRSLWKLYRSFIILSFTSFTRRHQRQKNAAHIHKRHENFAVFLLRPIFFKSLKWSIQSTFFSESVAVRSSMCLNFSKLFCAKIFSSNASTGSVCEGERASKKKKKTIIFREK